MYRFETSKFLDTITFLFLFILFFAISFSDASPAAEIPWPCVRLVAQHSADARFRSLHIPLHLWAYTDTKSILLRPPGVTIVPIPLYYNEPGAKHQRSIRADR